MRVVARVLLCADGKRTDERGDFGRRMAHRSMGLEKREDLYSRDRTQHRRGRHEELARCVACGKIQPEMGVEGVVTPAVQEKKIIRLRVRASRWAEPLCHSAGTTIRVQVMSAS